LNYFQACSRILWTEPVYLAKLEGKYIAGIAVAEEVLGKADRQSENIRLYL